MTQPMKKKPLQPQNKTVKKTVKKVQKTLAGTGAIPSPRDYRDIQLASIAPLATALPPKHMEDVSMLPVWHQRKLGACVGHAFAKYKQHLDFLDTNKVVPLSARYLYALAKCRDGYTDEGTYPRLVASILYNEGCATEKTVPNDTTLAHEAYVYGRKEANLPAGANKDAIPYKIASYAFANPQNVVELKRAIVEGHGASLLLQLGAEWYTAKSGVITWEGKEIIPLRAPKTVISGHEVFLFGYEDTEDGRTKFFVFNSWSTDWGDDGLAWFYHDEYKKYLVEAVTIVDVPNHVLDEVHNLPPEDKFKHSFNTNLVFGQRGDEVTALQTALKIDGVYTGPITGYYGALTAAGLLAFWKKYGLTTNLENLILRGRSAGPKTRAKLNQLFSN